MGYANGSGSYVYQSRQSISATANYGYHFTQWNDDNTDNLRTIQVLSDTTFTAEFAKNIYTISVETEHGSVAGGGDYEYLSTVQLTATADEHYHFTQWSDWNTNNPRQITVVEDKTYTAIFSIDQHTISASAEHGTVNGVGTYNYSTNVTLTAIPNLGYEFSNWADGNTDNPRTIELTQDTTLEAIFDYQLTGKCGKDNALIWTLDKSTMALNITGMGALSENYTYGTFIESLTINNEITSIGQDAFYGCKNLKKVIIGSSVKVLEEYAFSGCSAIESITCYSQRPPTVNNKALNGLDYGTIVYVPADYLNTYKMHDAWGLYDVRPIGAKNVETTEVTTSTTSNDVTITWPITDGTDTYTLTITKNGEVVCVLTFNANGQLTNIAFAAPGHNGARQAPAATLTAQGYQFTVTGLNPGTAYNYSVTATDAGGQTLAEHKGNFSTTGGESSLESVHGTQSTMHKVLRNGQILLERNNATYTPMGQKVK